MTSGLVDRHISFLEALRAAGLSVSLAEDLDAVAALSVLDWDSREVVRTAYAATLLKKQSQRPTFDALFERQQEWASHHAPNLAQAWEIAAANGLNLARGRRDAK